MIKFAKYVLLTISSIYTRDGAQRTRRVVLRRSGRGRGVVTSGETRGRQVRQPALIPPQRRGTVEAKNKPAEETRGRQVRQPALIPPQQCVRRT